MVEAKLMRDSHKEELTEGSQTTLHSHPNSGGDMLKSSYDTTLTGNKVDTALNSEKLNSHTEAQVQDHTPKSHGNEVHSATFITQAPLDTHAALPDVHHAQAHTLASHSTKAHNELTSIGEDDHHTKFTITEHDLTARHTLGTVVPHDALASLTEKDHTNLTSKGTNTHAQIDTHLGSTSNPHSTSDANLATSDIVTNDVSITKHGFTPKAPNNNTKFLRGDAAWADLPATGIGYALSVQALTSSPTDGQTVYFGNLPKAPQTTADRSKVYIRKAGTIKIAEIYCYSGTAGTNEAWSLYIRKNNATDTLIATLSVATSERVFSNAALNIAVAAGDYIEIKGIQPSWATNPATTIYGGYIYIE